MNARPSIRIAQSCASDSRQAAREFHAGVCQPEMELVVFFCSSQYDLEALADEMNRLFPGIRVAGCTTAGEIGPSGYRTHSLTGVSFGVGAFTAEVALWKGLQTFEPIPGQAFVRSLLQQMKAREPASSPDNTFAFLLIDGLSNREEAVSRAFQNALDDIPLVGGSAADDLKFSGTWVFHNGAFHTDATLLILVTTPYPFKIFKTQHFISDTERLVVTKADTARRIVQEINGLPAAREYARLIGVPTEELTPACFAASPVVVMIDGTDYVRSIQKMNPDGSLTFYCAIDEGLVFRVAHGENLMANLERTFGTLREEIGSPQLIFACDCILRDVETIQRGLKETVGDLFRRNNAIGFSTYGEQFCGVHVNQTLTGIAIGTPDEAGQSANRGNGLQRQDNKESLAATRGTSGRAGENAGSATMDSTTLPADEATLRNEITRLNKVVEALMDRAERSMGSQSSDFGMFQTAIQLENLVRARTRELEAAERENERINRDLQRANRELEAFSYSVAHDLRSPLRSISGFSRILENEAAEQLRPQDLEHLHRIREGAQRMGELIDDLLHLSRCSRAELRWEAVDLASLARQAIANFRREQPERQVEFQVPDSLPAHGDARLLAVLLENLLGNAWKYSRGRNPAHIEFGYDPALSAYFVRDNGAGFDMAYAGKLFQVCQRLHSISEFEGTGIGLAIVQRVVERHGGRVWAEAKVDQGATIRFTLPDEGAA